LLKNIKDQGAASVAMEVSSHALDQGRINGVEFDTVVITNLSQDHLDYHGTMSEYAAAKKKIINLPGIKHIVINADDAFGQECLQYLANRVANTNITVWAYATQAEKLLALPCFANKNYKKVLASDIHLINHGMTFNLHVSGEDLG
ncbi:MAG: Mur ligase family protein, partial [Polynucleobacter victoriensis]